MNIDWGIITLLALAVPFSVWALWVGTKDEHRHPPKDPGGGGE
ncbi:MAG TPA: hypothetical protein VF059_03145 [Casimicrobiaceae bacterium]